MDLKICAPKSYIIRRKRDMFKAKIDTVIFKMIPSGRRRYILYNAGSGSFQ